MSVDTVGAKPSVHLRNSEMATFQKFLKVWKSMVMAFRTERSVCIIVDGRIS